ALRRRTAARRTGPRAGTQSGDPGRRRADRKSRRDNRQADHRIAVRRAHIAQHHADPGDARQCAGAALRPHRAAALGTDRKGDGNAGDDTMTLTGGRLPLWVKIVYTAFMAVLVPVYWHYYGPTNFLYFCDVALILTLVGVWIESPLLISMCAVGILMPQAFW